MGEKKPISLSIERNPYLPIRHAFFASQFAVRAEFATQRILEILFQPSVGSLPVQCLVLDVTSLHDNKEMFLHYLAGLKGEPEDRALNDKLPYTTQSSFANIFQCSMTGERSETLFGLTAIHDAANIRRKGESGKDYQLYYDSVLAVYGSIGFQKKLISEIFRALN